MNICHSKWFNNEADWLLIGQAEARLDLKTKREHESKGEESEDSEEEMQRRR